MLRAVRNFSHPKTDAPLQTHIDWYVSQGFRVVSQTDSSAQLVKPKQFSFLWALLWLLALGIGLIVYLLYYIGKHDQTVYLTVVEGVVRSH